MSVANNFLQKNGENVVHISQQFSERCPVTDTLDIIGGKWKVLIIHHLIQRPKRFNELRRDLPLITQRMLTLQLKELVRDGVVSRHDYHEVPPKVDYALTEQGQTLLPVLNAMHHWGEQHAQDCLMARQNNQSLAEFAEVAEG